MGVSKATSDPLLIKVYLEKPELLKKKKAVENGQRPDWKRLFWWTLKACRP